MNIPMTRSLRLPVTGKTTPSSYFYSSTNMCSSMGLKRLVVHTVAQHTQELPNEDHSKLLQPESAAVSVEPPAARLLYFFGIIRVTLPVQRELNCGTFSARCD